MRTGKSKRTLDEHGRCTGLPSTTCHTCQTGALDTLDPLGLGLLGFRGLGFRAHSVQGLGFGVPRQAVSLLTVAFPAYIYAVHVKYTDIYYAYTYSLKVSEKESLVHLMGLAESRLSLGSSDSKLICWKERVKMTNVCRPVCLFCKKTTARCPVAPS